MNKALAVALAAFAAAAARGAAAEEGGPAPAAAAAPAAGNKETTVKIVEKRSGEWSMNLTEEEKLTLFAIARDTLDACVHGPVGRPFSFDAYTITPRLREKTANFVTLTVDGRLRGCIGSLAPVEPLFESIHNNTINAATDDPRFRAVSAEEVPAIDFHLSLLSPIRPIASLDEFRLGEHGIILEKGAYRAVYLPEVAVEQNWTRDETLTSLSHKAGLPGDGWRQGARFKVFSSVVLEAKR